MPTAPGGCRTPPPRCRQSCLGNVAGQRVLDLCAAPGGKTAELAAAGALVTAVDSSARRLKTLRANLERLKLAAEVIEADATSWRPAEPFDAVLLDAPCLATGTIRRHPDLPFVKGVKDLAPLTELQAKLLAAAAHMVRPGGRLVYCTCSLEPEEGQEQVAKFLREHPDFALSPIVAGEAAIEPDWLTPEGYLRTLPFHGLDGFFAARFVRS